MPRLRVTAGPHGFGGGLVEAPLAALGLSADQVRLTRLRAVGSAGAVRWQEAADGSVRLHLAAPLDAGRSLDVELVDRGEAASDGVPHARSVSVEVGLDRLTFRLGADLLAVYNFLGGRRPYFWPVLSPRGQSVARGQGTGDHPHHTGLNLAYGGHSEGGATNIWSDWDEPPYGPGGRMVHLGFEQVGDGPVGACAVERLAYTTAQGAVFLHERRHLFVWTDGAGRRYVDWRSEFGPIGEPGPRPFFLACRLADSMQVPARGRVLWEEGRPWVAASGPAGGDAGRDASAAGKDPGHGHAPAAEDWHGVAILDHPANPGYPSRAQRLAVAAQITFTHYPPPDGDGACTLRHRVVVFDGAADPAALDALQRDYAEPCAVTPA